MVQRSDKGPGWAPAVAQPLCVSLSPSRSHELFEGAEAPGAPSSEPGDTTAAVGICLLGTHSCGPLTSLMDN